MYPVLRFRTLWAISTVLWGMVCISYSQYLKFGKAFSISNDNDSLANADGDYSAGMELTWTQASRASVDERATLPRWLKHVSKRTPFGHAGVDRFGSRIVLGQKIYTPRDLRKTELIEDDRPYAGWTYLNLSLHARKQDRLDSIILSVGIIGPASFADEVQENVHEFFGAVRVRGWKNQLKNEFALNLSYLRDRIVWQKDSDSEYEMELVSLSRIDIGNVDTSASCGLRWRGGRNLESDFDSDSDESSHRIEGIEPKHGSHSKFRFSHLLEMRGIVVARNIFLDGNTFKESHSVEKKNALVEISWGIDYGNRKKRASMRYTYRSKEFDLQKSGSSFIRFALEFGL